MDNVNPKKQGKDAVDWLRQEWEDARFKATNSLLRGLESCPQLFCLQIDSSFAADPRKGICLHVLLNREPTTEEKRALGEALLDFHQAYESNFQWYSSPLDTIESWTI